jgi:hypothetical protein
MSNHSLPLFLRKSSFICIYLRLCLWHLALDTRVGQSIRDIWLFFAFMKNCLLVVTISHVWDVIIFLCFCGASGGATLLTLAFPCINGVTKVTQHHLCGYGHPNFWLHCVLQPLVCRLYLRPKLLWESILLQLADCQVLFTPSGEDWSH